MLNVYNRNRQAYVLHYFKVLNPKIYIYILHLHRSKYEVMTPGLFNRKCKNMRDLYLGTHFNKYLIKVKF